MKFNGVLQLILVFILCHSAALALISNISNNAVDTLCTRQAAGECAFPPRDQCGFYNDCLEPRYHCGASGYPIAYGTHFCQRFSTGRNNLSAKGKDWMLDTMGCLQRALVLEAIGGAGAVRTCDELKHKAFGTHAKCYVNNGLCTLSPSDWLSIVKIVDLETLFDSWDAFKESVKAAVECLEFEAFLVLHGF